MMTSRNRRVWTVAALATAWAAVTVTSAVLSLAAG